jgi:hypothetical protein
VIAARLVLVRAHVKGLYMRWEAASMAAAPAKRWRLTLEPR